MNDLKEMQTKVDIKIAELRQQAHFAINKYDYHHKNDELQIIERQTDILIQAAGTYTSFLNEMQKFNKTLSDAKDLNAKFEQLLQSQPTTQQHHQHQEHQHMNERSNESTIAFTACTKDKFKDTTS